MAKTIYLLRYNNYFNRTVKKKFAMVNDYVEIGNATVCAIIRNVLLWNPNDGIETTFVSSTDLTAVPDYLLVEEDNAVVSRWFVIEAQRLAKTQYKLSLKRDVLSEEMDIILGNPNTYIERGWCDVSSNAIYNKEPFSFNQIKKGQVGLYDISCVPWIVMYFTRSKTTESGETNFPENRIDTIDPSNKTKEFISYLSYEPDGSGKIASLTDAPYAMITIPYHSHSFYKGETKVGSLSRENIIEIVRSISEKYSSSGWLLDIQLLPYCPCKSFLRQVSGSYYIDLNKATNYVPIYYENVGIQEAPTNLVGGIVSCERSSFSMPLNQVNGADYSIDVGDIKVNTNTTFYRLVSPNGNGVFEFDAAKLAVQNNQHIQIVASCTYMPFQPYIRLYPQFGRLYGEDFFDHRGLICGGDFSLPQINDSWSAYQIQNKNYQVMFNRQIESFDKQSKAAFAQDIVGAVSGGFSGAVGGGVVGGPAGAIAGGIISAGAGAATVGVNTWLRSDQREATIQQHNWQLQNVQALPYSVSKANNFNIDSLYVPYIETYSCSDEEKANFEKYLAAYGYTINRMGKPLDYLQRNAETWIQGTLIRIDGIVDDAHYIATLADEMKQGFYIKVEG